MRYFSKHECLERAEKLLAGGDDDVLTYAALELRQAIEAAVYDKLNVYDKYVPRAIFETWQPHHALKMLLEFEPDGDQDMRLRFAEEDPVGVAKGPWISLGEHRSFKASWLNKNYNKLSSYIHVPRRRHRQIDPATLRSYLQKVATEVRAVVDSTLTGVAMASRYSFTCGACGKKSLANEKSVEKYQKAVCIHPNCGAIHRPRWKGDTWSLVLETSDFDCLVCKSPIPIENRKLEIGHEFVCASCKTDHVIIVRQWGYATKKDAQEHGEPRSE